MNDASKIKRVLFVANEPFSQQSSNGRTLMNMVGGIDKSLRAQFYLHGSPDMDFCQYYYKVSDADALKALLSITPKKHSKLVSDFKNKKSSSKNLTHSKDGKRNCRNYLIRNLIWLTFRWWNKYFNFFLDEVNPGVVFLQAGDSPFMYAIALKIAKKYSAKLVMYNSESYPLKGKLYSSSSEKDVFHKALKSLLRYYYARFMKKVDFCFYSMEELEKDYQARYPHRGKSKTLYTATDMESLPDESERFNLTYCGNLGVGRAKPLSEIAKVLKDVDADAVLNVYGNFINENDEKTVCENDNVKYHGFVPYNEIAKVMSKATVLIHCENEENLENLRYAFSTKIADSLACGRPFFVYASDDFPFVKYLVKNDVAHIARNKKEIYKVLSRIKKDLEFRNKYISRAQALAQKNHSLDIQCQYVEAVLNRLL